MITVMSYLPSHFLLFFARQATYTPPNKTHVKAWCTTNASILWNRVRMKMRADSTSSESCRKKWSRPIDGTSPSILCQRPARPLILINKQEQGIQLSHLPCRYPFFRKSIRRAKSKRATINQAPTNPDSRIKADKPKAAASAAPNTRLQESGRKVLRNDPPESGINFKIGNYWESVCSAYNSIPITIRHHTTNNGKQF